MNIDLLAQNSIVPSARSIARLKMSGRLPNLHINFSDSKYKTLMHLLDVTLPRLGDAAEGGSANQQAEHDRKGFPPRIDLFGTGQAEYVVDDASVKGAEDESQTLRAVAQEVSSSNQHYGYINLNT